jgi:hypothetical protein
VGDLNNMSYPFARESSAKEVERELEYYRRQRARRELREMLVIIPGAPLFLTGMVVIGAMWQYNFWDLGYALAFGTPLFPLFLTLVIGAIKAGERLRKRSHRKDGQKRVPYGFPRYSDDEATERYRQRLLAKFPLPATRA